MKRLIFDKKIWLILISFLCVVIIFSIYFIQNQQNKSNNTSFTVNLKGYDSLKEKIYTLNSTNGPQDGAIAYERIVPDLTILENNKKSSNDKYQTLLDIVSTIEKSYLYTNDPQYPSFIKTISDFSKENFPKEFNSGDFSYQCADPTCATTPVPKEVQDAIDQINQSNVDQRYKTTYIRNILNASYLPTKTEDQINYAVGSYLVAVGVLKSNPVFSENNLGDSVYNQIRSYLEKTYPVELKKAESK